MRKGLSMGLVNVKPKVPNLFFNVAKWERFKSTIHPDENNTERKWLFQRVKQPFLKLNLTNGRFTTPPLDALSITNKDFEPNLDSYQFRIEEQGTNNSFW